MRRIVFGQVSEWPMVSDSKSDVRKHRGFKSLPVRQFKRLTGSPHGAVTEWPKVHDWKSCVLKGTEGSNPSRSADGVIDARVD